MSNSNHLKTDCVACDFRRSSAGSPMGWCSLLHVVCNRFQNCVRSSLYIRGSGIEVPTYWGMVQARFSQRSIMVLVGF